MIRICDPTWHPALYDRLRQQARRLMALERAGHTLQPTALVHDCSSNKASISLSSQRCASRCIALPSQSRQIMSLLATKNGPSPSNGRAFTRLPPVLSSSALSSENTISGAVRPARWWRIWSGK